jgi:hypothetical protein
LRALVEAPIGPDGHGGRAQVPQATRSGGRRRRLVAVRTMTSRRSLRGWCRVGASSGCWAAGAGLAVAGSALTPDPAAASGTMLFGTNNDAGTGLTSLTSSSAADTLQALPLEADTRSSPTRCRAAVSRCGPMLRWRFVAPTERQHQASRRPLPSPQVDCRRTARIDGSLQPVPLPHVSARR